MKLLLLISLALAGPGKRGKRQEPVPEPPAIPPPELPLGVAPPTDLTPALEGALDALQLVGLRRTSIRFEFGYDTTALEGLGTEERQALWRHLAADPRWRVTKIGDVRLAEQRIQEDGQWFVGMGGYNLDSEKCHRVALREGTRAMGTPWARSDLVAHGAVGTGEVELRVFALQRPPCTNQQAVALSVDGPISLEVFESGEADALPITTQALTTDMTFVRNATIDPASVLATGYESHALGGPLPTDTQVIAQPRAGGISIQGADNPGQPGWLWVRILSNGEVFEDRRFAAATMEQVGWSSDSTQRFPWQSMVPLPTGVTVDGSAEIWFAPDDGPPRALREVPIRIDSGPALTQR